MRPETQPLDGGAPAVPRLVSELLLDAKQLIVLRGAIGSRERAGLDLPAVGGDREIGNRRVLGLAGAM